MDLKLVIIDVICYNNQKVLGVLLMSEIKLSLDKREVTGKKTKALRDQGLIPSVVYGGDKEPKMTQSDYNITEKALNSVGYHSPIDLTIDGKVQLAMVKNVSIDPVKRRITNVEFHAINAEDAIVAEAPIELVGLGTSGAEKKNLSILQVMDTVEVKAKPADLPSSLDVDISGLEDLDDKITLEDIKLPEGVKFADPELDMTSVVANVYDSAVEAAKVETEEEVSDESADVPSEHGDEKPAEEEKAE